MSRDEGPEESEAKHEEEGLGRFGRYSLIEHLAKGGMAQIYKAATPNGKIFTLKQILPDYSNSTEFVRMFLEEAKISLNLKHPNIVRVLDFGQVESSYFLAMEYVFGRDVGSLLRASVEKRVYIPVDVACLIILQCARGLDYAHKLVDSFGKVTSIIHRDISPPNILVGYNGDAKILDFGIAKAQRATTRTNTRSGVLKGKFSYMSPEQASGLQLSPQSDLFSLGIVFWELLTSRSLFFSQDEIETLERVRKADVESPRKFRKELPPQVEKIALRALARKEKNRYQDCGEFAEAIRDFLKEHYPRSDARSIARTLRSLFPEDYQRRVGPAKKEGWVDVLVSGAADDDLILDRSFSENSGIRPHTQGHRISWLQRLLYDPRTSAKFYVGLGLGSLFALLAAGGFWAFQSGYWNQTYQTAKELWTQVQNSGQPASETVSPSAETPPATSPSTSPQPSAFGFSHFLGEADKSIMALQFDEALKSLQRAKEINPFDAHLKAQIRLTHLALGRAQEACNNLAKETEFAAEDMLLLTAACLEYEGDWVKAIGAYQEFLEKYPNHPRAKHVRLALNSISETMKVKE